MRTLPKRRLAAAIAQAELTPVVGRVVGAAGLVIEAAGPPARLNELCFLRGDGIELPAEVVGFREGRVLLMPLGEVDGLRPGWHVHATGAPLAVPAGEELLGRVLDGLGRPLDGKGPLTDSATRQAAGLPPPRSPASASPRRSPLGSGRWTGC